jgi:hypothetical protein
VPFFGVGFFSHGAKYNAKTRFVRMVNFAQFRKMLLLLYVLGDVFVGCGR